MNKTHLGTETKEVTITEVFGFSPRTMDYVVVARFYAYGSTKKKRQETTESLAAIFINATKDRNSVSYKIGQHLATAVIALHKGAVKWNETTPHQPGYRFAGLIALLTDGLIDPGEYL